MALAKAACQYTTPKPTPTLPRGMKIVRGVDPIDGRPYHLRYMPLTEKRLEPKKIEKIIDIDIMFQP